MVLSNITAGLAIQTGFDNMANFIENPKENLIQP